VKEILAFLQQLEDNNTREWFQEHKNEYKSAEKEFRTFLGEVEIGLSEIDKIDTEATKVYRIYRDVRFSDDKTPYHLHRSAGFRRATTKLRGGYYLKIKRGQSVIVGGFFNPNPPDILHIRKQIQQDPSPLQELLSTAEIKGYFGGLSGEQVKSSPRGFSKEDAAIHLLRYKQLLLKKDFADHEVVRADFASKVVEGFSKMRPFFDYMSAILTTDLNGEAIEE